MRSDLTAVLLQDTDLLILDEPTNFLDLLGITWLEQYIQTLHEITDYSIVIVSHDRTFLDNLCDETIIFKDKSLHYHKGNLSAYEEDLHERRLYLTRAKEASDRQTLHFEKTIAENIKIGKKTGDDNRLRQAKSRQKRVNERSGMQVNSKGQKFKLSRDSAGVSS